mgnify:CR=1 FL=1
MGFFSKVFKGVKKAFKSIGKGIKKVATKVGKFMDKIGIVGQIGMAFILPGIGAALGSTLGSLGAWAATAGGNALVQGAKFVVGAATKFVTTGARIFNTVTSGVKNFVGEFAKTALNKIPGITVEGASTNFFGANGAFGKAAGATADTWNTTIGSSKWMEQFDPTPKTTDRITASELGLEAPQADSIGPETYEDYMDTPRPAPEGIPSIQAQQPITAPELPEFAVEGPSLLSPADMPVPEPVDITSTGGFTFTEEAVSAAGTQLVKEGAKALLAPEVEPYDFSSAGQVVGAQQFGVETSGQIMQMPQVAYGYPQVAYDSMYRPTSTWARRMGAMG